MQKIDRVNSRLFATVNNLVPIQELSHIRNYYNKINYREAAEYIKSAGLELTHFYFKRDDPFAYFCYYRDLVFIDIPIFTQEALESFQIMELIKFEQQRFQNCLSRKDFKTLFYIVDKRIAFAAFEKLFESIPDQDKYETFWFVYSRCGLGLDDFPPEYIQEILRYRPQPLNLPGDELIEVFRGQGHDRNHDQNHDRNQGQGHDWNHDRNHDQGHNQNHDQNQGQNQDQSQPPTTPIQLEHSWTLDINTAIRYAVQKDRSGQVYRAKINKQDVAAYIKRKNEKELVVFPAGLQDIEPVQLLSFADLKPHLQRLGIIDHYNHYEKLLKKEYFYRPEGIHGLMHTRRVLLLNLIISCLQGCPQRFVNILCTAALYHDIGRINDNFDPRHGIESYRKAQQLNLINLVDQPDQGILQYIMENHCVSDKQAREQLDQYNLKDQVETENLFNIFKDADGLDRVRINDLDIRQLRTDYGRQLPLVARQLHDHFYLFESFA